MFSTALTVIDAFPRVISRTVRAVGTTARSTGDTGDIGDTDLVYRLAMGVLGLLTVVVVALFAGSLTAMVDFATIVSFLTGPILGYLNLRAVTADHIAPEDRPGRGLVLLSYGGLVLLGGTAAIYLLSLT